MHRLSAASTSRWAAGKPLSVLDGVPFAVKDAIDALPYPTTAGTAYMAKWWVLGPVLLVHALWVLVALPACNSLLGKSLNCHCLGP